MNDKRINHILKSLCAITRISIWGVDKTMKIVYSQADYDNLPMPDFSVPLFANMLEACKKENRSVFISGSFPETYATVFWPDEDIFFILGPVLCDAPKMHDIGRILCFPDSAEIKIPFITLRLLCHMMFVFCSSIGISCEDGDTLYATAAKETSNTSDTDFNWFLYNQREKIVPHDGFLRERLFLDYVRRGDCEKLEGILQSLAVESTQSSTLSDNEKEQALFHLIACTTLVTRYAMEGGLNQSLAYNLSDFYIQKAKKCVTLSEMKSLLFSMTMDFTARVSALRKSRNYSYPVAAACEYIFSNLHYNISLSDIAATLQRSEGYLSTVFKNETGMTVMEFIRKERLKEACSLLQHTTKTCYEISSSLSYTSQSYFSEQFRKEYGMTPLQYREKHKV